MKKLPGLILAIIIGLAAYFLSQIHILFDPLVLGILLGMIARLIIGANFRFLSGLEIAPHLFIPLGIVLYGTNLNLYKLSEISPLAWLQLIVSILIIFWLTNFIGQLLKIDKKTSILTAVGMAICGASAIIMVAPAIKAKKEDAGNALLTITFLGLAVVFLYPFIQKLFSIPENTYALFSATTLSQTGFVKMAALFLSKNAETLALSIKVARTALIIPVLIILSIIFREEKNEEEVTLVKSKIIYWSMAGFILAGLSFSFIPGLIFYAKIMKPYSAILWTLALTSIGLTIEIKSLLKNLFRPLILGFILWLTAVIIFMFGYWTMS